MYCRRHNIHCKELEYKIFPTHTLVPDFAAKVGRLWTPNLELFAHPECKTLAEESYLGYNLRRPGRVAQLVRAHGSHP